MGPKEGFEKNNNSAILFNNNRWSLSFRNRWPSGPPTSETRWPFGKSGGQWPPGHREFRALMLCYNVGVGGKREKIK